MPNYVDSRKTVGLMVEQDVVMDALGCQKCGAPKGSMCMGVLRRNGSRRRRTTLHLERYVAYKRDVLGVPVGPLRSRYV